MNYTVHNSSNFGVTSARESKITVTSEPNWSRELQLVCCHGHQLRQSEAEVPLPSRDGRPTDAQTFTHKSKYKRTILTYATAHIAIRITSDMPILLIGDMRNANIADW